MEGLLHFRCVFMMALLCECVDGGWSFWSDWTTCPIPCEGKSIWRKRYCKTQFCNGNYFEYRNCEPQDCPVTTKLITSLRQQQNLATPTVTRRMGKRQTLNIRTSTPVLLTTSTKPSYTSVKAPHRTRHVSLSLNYSNKHHGLNTINTEENLHPTKRLTITSTSVKTTRQILTLRDMIKETGMKATPTMKTKEKDGDTSVVTIAISVTAVCVVLYTTAKLYTMFCREEKRQPSEGVGGTETVSAKALSLDPSKIDRPAPERVYDDYNYVPYDEISKGMNKSPTHSYVYDVTWL